MAITSANLSIGGVQGILTAGRQAYERLMQGQTQAQYLKNTLRELEVLIGELQGQEAKICGLANVSSIEDLRNKINKFNAESGLNNFTGSALRQDFTRDFANAAKRLKTEEDKEIAQLGQYIVDQIFATQTFSGKTGAELNKAFLLFFHRSLVQGTITSGGNLKSDFETVTRKAIINFGDKAPQFILEKITPTIRNRLSKILQSSSLKRYPLLDKMNITSASIKGNTASITIRSEWFNATKGLTATEIQARIKKNPEIWIPVRDEANKTIMQKILSKISSSARTEATKVIEQMLAKNPNMFFVGGAATEVTGLLGEMSTYIMLRNIFGENAKIQWVAQQMADGKKLSIDFVLENLYGIQVKNTTQDLNNFSLDQLMGLEIGFVDRSASDVIRKLVGSEDLGNVYESSYFNVCYEITNHHPAEISEVGSNAEFGDIAAQLVSLREQIKSFLLAFSPQLLYMANNAPLRTQLANLGNQLRSLRGNILFMVGNQPIFASEMLTKVQAQIKRLLNIIEEPGSVSFLEISGSGETIVNYLMQRAASGQMIGLERQGANKKGNHSVKAGNFNVIKMTSKAFY